MNAVRRATLMGLVDRYGLTVGGDSNTADEDVTAYFSGEADVHQFCAITRGGEFTYLKAGFDTLDAAIEFSVSNIADSIYPESPVCIVDLDRGTEWWPKWSTLEWKVNVMSLPPQTT